MKKIWGGSSLTMLVLFSLLNLGSAIADPGLGHGGPGHHGPGPGFGPGPGGIPGPQIFPGGGGPVPAFPQPSGQVINQQVVCSAPWQGENRCYVNGQILNVQVQVDYSGRCVLGNNLTWNQEYILVSAGCSAGLLVTSVAQGFPPVVQPQPPVIFVPQPQPPVIFVPQPQPQQRIITVTGNGSGGTSHGDKNAACERARERAQNNAEDSCRQNNGRVIQELGSSGCSCHRQDSKDDYICRTEVRVSCERDFF